MKRLAVALVLAVIIAAICTCEFITVDYNNNTYTKMLDEISAEVEKEDFNKALSISEEVLTSWEKTVSGMDTFIYHDYMDSIGLYMNYLPVYIKAENKTGIETTVKSIKIQLDSLKRSELPTYYNIF